MQPIAIHLFHGTHGAAPTDTFTAGPSMISSACGMIDVRSAGGTEHTAAAGMLVVIPAADGRAC